LTSLSWPCFRTLYAIDPGKSSTLLGEPLTQLLQLAPILWILRGFLPLLDEFPALWTASEITDLF
jgi:hypothetical protein